MNYKSWHKNAGLLVLMFLILLGAGLSAALAQPESTRSIEERAFPQKWRISLNVIGRHSLDIEELRRRVKFINPNHGEAIVSLKDGAIAGDIIWSSRKGEKSAGKITGWLRGDRFAMVLSYPSDFLKVEGRYKFEKFESEHATLNGKAYSSFHMTPDEYRMDNFPNTWSLRFDNSAGRPETIARVHLRKEGENLVGRTVRGEATRVRYGNDTSPARGNIVGLFEGSIKGDQFKGSCTESTGKTVLNGKWDPFTSGFFGKCTRDGGSSGSFFLSAGGYTPANFTKPEERRLQMVLSPPLQGARIHISPSMHLKTWQNQARATMSYRIGWCGNEVPTKVEYEGTCSNGNVKLKAITVNRQPLISSLDIRLGTDGVAFTGTAICSDSSTRSIKPWSPQKSNSINRGR